MKSNRIVIGAFVAMVFVLSTLSTPARGDPPANPVTEWNTIAVTTLIGLPGPAGGAPPAAQVHVAMVQGAVYDAVNAIEPKHYRPYLLNRRFSARASKDAAVATAAYVVLRTIVSTVPNFTDPARATLLDSLATQYANSLAGVPNGPFKTQGIAAGNAAAAAMISARQDDGRFGPSQWVPNTAPGHWWPQLNAAGQPILDPTPWVGGVDPFAMQTSSQFRTPGPNALTSAAWATEFNEVKALGSATSAVRTTHQTYVARWWQSTPVAIWNSVATDLAERDGLSIADTARLLAMENLSGADAAINCWNDKYYWDFWRPWNAIPRAAEDGNPATLPERRLDAADRGAVPGPPVGSPVPRRRAHAHPADVLRRRHRGWLRDHQHVDAPGGRPMPAPAASVASRRQSRRSPRPASGPVCTTARPTSRRRCSAGTSPTTRRRTTSSPWDAPTERGNRPGPAGRARGGCPARPCTVDSAPRAPALTRGRGRAQGEIPALSSSAPSRRGARVGRQEENDMSVEETERTIRSYLDTLSAGGDFASFFADDIVWTTMETGDEIRGREAVRDFIVALHTQLFDASPEFGNVTFADGVAGLEAVFVGTHTADFAGVPATGTAVRLPYSVSYDVSDGAIVALRAYFPITALVQQLRDAAGDR